MKNTLIRLLLSGVMIYFSYKETGIFTALCILFAMIAIELLTDQIHELKMVVKELSEIQKEGHDESNQKNDS